MADTNWVTTNFAIAQENGGNMFTEDGFIMCLEEFDNTVWAIDTEAGSG